MPSRNYLFRINKVNTNNVSNLFKTNNKDTRATSLMLFWCLNCWLRTIFTQYSGFCVIDFDWVKIGWVRVKYFTSMNIHKYKCFMCWSSLRKVFQISFHWYQHGITIHAIIIPWYLFSRKNSKRKFFATISFCEVIRNYRTAIIASFDILYVNPTKWSNTLQPFCRVDD